MRLNRAMNGIQKEHRYTSIYLYETGWGHERIQKEFRYRFTPSFFQYHLRYSLIHIKGTFGVAIVFYF